MARRTLRRWAWQLVTLPRIVEAASLPVLAFFTSLPIINDQRKSPSPASPTLSLDPSPFLFNYLSRSGTLLAGSAKRFARTSLDILLSQRRFL